MTPKEQKELVGYLKKETKRLRNAIQKEEQKGNYGKVAHHKHSLDTFQKFLENIYSENKKILFLFIVIQSFLFSSYSFINNDTALSGKTFIVDISEKSCKEAKPFKYQIAFKDDKLCPKAIGIRNKQDSLPAGFSPGFYSRTIDSSESQQTIIFSSLSKKNCGETLLWLGYVEGNAIRGAVHWSGGKKKYKLFSFSGTLKEVINSKAK